METIVRPMSWEDFPGPARPRYEALRAPGVGEAKVLDENFFMETALRSTVLSGLSAEDLEAYREPYPTRESRRPLLQWSRSDKPLFWALLGAAVLVSYGVVAALRPIPAFGRVYAAYGGVFVGLALLWGITVEGYRPDKYDILGAIVAFCGMLVMVVPSRG